MAAGGGGIGEELVAWVADALEPVGHVTARRMMGGHTLYCDGTVFAIVAADVLWFKADAASDAIWDEAEAGRFSYARGDETTATMNYRLAPGDVHDDPDEMRRWAALALAAGRRAPPRRRRQAAAPRS